MNFSAKRKVRGAGRVLAMVWVVVVAGSCGGGGSETPREGEVVIPETTKILDQVTRDALAEVGEDGTLRFNTMTELLQGLEPGDIVVSEAAQAAPYGLLRKVVSVESAGGQVVVKTTRAMLNEAVEQGSFEFIRELEPADLAAVSPLRPGVVARGLTLDLVNVPFSTDFGTGQVVTATGSVKVGPFIEVSGKIGGFKLQKFRVKVGVKGSVDLSIKASASVGIEKSVELGKFKFKTFWVAMGGVFPVSITPEITVYLNGKGSLSAKLTFSVQEKVTLATGFEYVRGSGIQDISERQADFQKSGPTLEGEADLKAGVEARFTVLLYGLAGPFGSLEVGPHFNAKAVVGPEEKKLKWKLEGCLWLSVGVEAQVLDLEYDKDIYQACSMFAQGEVELQSGGGQGGKLVWLEVYAPTADPKDHALDVSTTGKVVGYHTPPLFGQDEANLWTPDGKLHQYLSIGDYYTEQFVAISADGATIVAYGGPINATTTHDWHALVWTGGETVTNLGDLVADGSTEPTDISADGTVVVGSSWTSWGMGPVNEHAFYWTSSSGLQDLGTLGGTSSKATAVSGDGRVVVGISDTSDGQTKVFRWVAGEGMQALEDIDSVLYDTAPVVSDDGSVIVVGTDQWSRSGVRWSVSDGIDELDFWPLGVSGDGDVVVGWDETYDLPRHAVRWTPDGGRENLNDTYAHLLADGSRLEMATAISQDGRFIVGQGWHAGTGRQPFLLDTKAGQ